MQRVTLFVQRMSENLPREPDSAWAAKRFVLLAAEEHVAVRARAAAQVENVSPPLEH